MKTTNYFNTFISVADDCPAVIAEVPARRDNTKTVAYLQYEMIIDNPYKYTSDDVIFNVHAIRNQIPRSELKKAREGFFSKGQACLRCSPLTKRYGWGVHSDAAGRVALYAIESKEYRDFVKRSDVAHVKAMRSKR